MKAQGYSIVMVRNALKTVREHVRPTRTTRKYVDPTDFDETQRVFTIEPIVDAFFLKVGGMCVEDQAFFESLLSGHVQFIEDNEQSSVMVQLTGAVVESLGIPLEKQPALSEEHQYRIIFLSCETDVDRFFEIKSDLLSQMPLYKRIILHLKMFLRG